MGAGSAFQATTPVSSRKKHHISEETITLQKIEKKLASHNFNLIECDTSSLIVQMMTFNSTTQFVFNNDSPEHYDPTLAACVNTYSIPLGSKMTLSTIGIEHSRRAGVNSSLALDLLLLDHAS